MTPTPATHVWKPSVARRVTLDAFVPVPRGSVAVAPAPLNWPTKDPADILDYEFDISPALIGNEGDSIASLGVAITPSNPGDLTLSSAAADGCAAVLWLAGGQAGTVYTVTIAITTANGRTVQRSVLLPVLYLSQPPVPTNAIETNTGLVITDQNGNPVVTS
jgi:hypothetical protein